MKSLIISTILFLIISTNAFSQTLTTIWTENAGWSGTSDKTTRLFWKPSGLYQNGWKSGSLGSFSATAKFNNMNGSAIWSKTDTTTLTYSGLPFCVLENAGKVFSVSSSLSNLYFYLVVRNKNTGEMEKIKQVEWHMSLCEYKDSVVAIVSKNPARVVVYNANADSIRGFNLGYSLANGFVTGKTTGNYLWIMGNFFSSGWYFFVEKRNLVSGEIMWRRNFPVSSINLYGDVDSNGTAYLGTYTITNASITKLDSANNVIWERILLNTENVAYRDVSINYKKNLILACGVNGNIGYVIGRDLQTGDSAFQFPVIWSAGATENSISSITSDTTGHFYISGHNMTSSVTQCHIRKYKYDTLTGITVISENPENFSLSQNYPNPFNPTTKINFSIPKKNHATITVYDILGKEVATLVNESLHPGTYETTFDASNLNSGIYFYRLQSGNFSATKKMLMIK